MSTEFSEKITVTQDFDVQPNCRSHVNAKERFPKSQSSESKTLSIFFSINIIENLCSQPRGEPQEKKYK